MFNNTTLTKEQLQYILNAQYALNTAFSGEEWKTNPVYPSGLNASSDAELGEFLNEIKAEWKLHGKPVNGNRDDAMFELVDVVHFMAAALNCALHRNGIDVGDYEEYIKMIDELRKEEYIPTNITVRDAPFYAQFSQYYRDFWSILDILNCDLSNNYLKINFMNAIRCMKGFVACGITKIGFNSEELLNAFKMKEARNYARIRGGILEGADVKKDEARLCL